MKEKIINQINKIKAKYVILNIQGDKTIKINIKYIDDINLDNFIYSFNECTQLITLNQINSELGAVK